MSQFGVIFAPRPAVVTAEIARVLVSGGRLVLFSWTPASWVGQLFRLISRHAPPPPNAPLPMAWGDEATAKERLAASFEGLRTRRDTYRMRFPLSPDAVLDFFLYNMGPIAKAYGSLNGMEKQQLLRADLERFFQQTNQGDPDAWWVDSEFLQVEGRKR